VENLVNWSECDTLNSQTFNCASAIISLENAQDRRELLLQAGFPPRLVEKHWPATDFRGSDYEDISDQCSIDTLREVKGANPRIGTIGNAVSQRNALEYMLAAGADLCVVFEDDARPSSDQSFQILNQVLSMLAPAARAGNAFMCHLGVKRSQRPRNINLIVRGSWRFLSGRWIIRDGGTAENIWRSHAYIISREAARRRIAGEAKIRVGSDDFNVHMKLGYFDNFFYVEPGLFYQDTSLPSSIQAGNFAAKSDDANTMRRLKFKDFTRRITASRVEL